MRKSSGSYYARFYDRTRDPKRKSWPLRTHRQDVARRRLSELERAMDRGQFDPWRGGYLVERLSLKEAEGRFLEAKELEGLRKSLSPGQMLSYLSSEDIRPYVYDPEVANSTRRHRYRHLNAWLNWCEDEGYLPDGNPMEDVSKPRKEERKSVFLSPSDLEHLLGTIDAHAEAMQSKPGRNPHDNWLKDVIQVAVATGLRRNELFYLRWGDVDLQNEFLWVRNREDGTFKTKSGSERTVPLAGDALNVLRKGSEQFPYTPTDPSSSMLMGGDSA